jgi:hypothetical protein
MYRQIEAVAPETSHEQRTQALQSALLYPSELAGAPTIGNLNGAPVLQLRGLPVVCRVSGWVGWDWVLGLHLTCDTATGVRMRLH